MLDLEAIYILRSNLAYVEMGDECRNSRRVLCVGGGGPEKKENENRHGIRLRIIEGENKL